MEFCQFLARNGANYEDILFYVIKSFTEAKLIHHMLDQHETLMPNIKTAIVTVVVEVFSPPYVQEHGRVEKIVANQLKKIHTIMCGPPMMQPVYQLMLVALKSLAQSVNHMLVLENLPVEISEVLSPMDPGLLERQSQAEIEYRNGLPPAPKTLDEISADPRLSQMLPFPVTTGIMAEVAYALVQLNHHKCFDIAIYELNSITNCEANQYMVQAMAEFISNQPNNETSNKILVYLNTLLAF